MFTAIALVVCARGSAADPTPRASLPVLDDVAVITLRQEQGGPSIRRCDGIVYEATIDLRANSWTAAWCMGKDTVRKPKSGKLAVADRDKIAAAYGKLTVRTTQTCGNDGGTLTLTIVKADKSSTKWVDENWGCRKPPPVIADGLRDFANIATSATPP